MKSLEKIKQEYQLFQTKIDYVESLEDLAALLEIKRDDIDDDLSACNKTIRYNNLQAKRMKLISYVIPFYADDIEYYQRDSEYLQEIIKVGDKWKEYYTILEECADEEQLKEWLRLLDFTSNYYNANVDYLESKRDDLELAFRGIDSFNPKFENSRTTFDEFFRESIHLLAPKKDIQKAKEI